MRPMFVCFSLLFTASASFAIAQTEHRAPIGDMAYMPITKEDAPKLFSAWGQAGLDRINAATKAAVEITATSPKCDAVFLSGYSFDRSVPKKSIAVFVDCSNGERFHYTEDETKTASAAPASVQDRLAEVTDLQAIRECEALTKPSVRFASTFDPSYLGANVTRGEQAISVALPFEAKNAMGNVLPYVAHCSFDGHKHTLLSVKER